MFNKNDSGADLVTPLIIYSIIKSKFNKIYSNLK